MPSLTGSAWRGLTPDLLYPLTPSHHRRRRALPLSVALIRRGSLVGHVVPNPLPFPAHVDGHILPASDRQLNITCRMHLRSHARSIRKPVLLRGADAEHRSSVPKGQPYHSPGWRQGEFYEPWRNPRLRGHPITFSFHQSESQRDGPNPIRFTAVQFQTVPAIIRAATLWPSRRSVCSAYLGRRQRSRRKRGQDSFLAPERCVAAWIPGTTRCPDERPFVVRIWAHRHAQTRRPRRAKVLLAVTAEWPERISTPQFGRAELLLSRCFSEIPARQESRPPGLKTASRPFGNASASFSGVHIRGLCHWAAAPFFCASPSHSPACPVVQSNDTVREPHRKTHCWSRISRSTSIALCGLVAQDKATALRQWAAVRLSRTVNIDSFFSP